ncbi:bifunctional protein FolD [Coprobacillus sp. CAG:698]|nr:bifunctional protein FolD [Coprobacillus sp. CAG:698]
MILDGLRTAEVIRKKIAEEVARQDEEITLAILHIGNDQSSMIYLESKEKACAEVGINTKILKLPENISQREILNIISDLNKDKTVNAIMVQTPLPKHIDTETILNSVDPMKDVDGLSIYNQGKLIKDLPCVVPATAQGVITLLKNNNIDISGKNVVIVGRSIVVGKPLAMLFLKENATVTIAHSHTTNLKDITKRADILAVAIGKPRFITADMVKKDAVVVDIGTNRVMGKICGDVDFENVQTVASYISPVPKGVGPMTTAMLLSNVIKCYQNQKMNRD